MSNRVRYSERSIGLQLGAGKRLHGVLAPGFMKAFVVNNRPVLLRSWGLTECTSVSYIKLFLAELIPFLFYPEGSKKDGGLCFIALQLKASRARLG